MNIAFLCAALTLIDQGVTTNPIPVPNPSLTFETRAALVGNVFEQLSAKTGVRLMTSPKTAEEVLILRLNDVPLTDLMAKIAAATCAEWQREAEGWRLIRSATLELRQRDAHFEIEAELIRQAQHRSRQTLADQAEFDDTKALAIGRQLENILSSIRSDPPLEGTRLVQQSASNSLPGSRLLMRVALMFDPKELARIEVGGREAFAIDPHRSQRALPKGTSKWIAEYVKERNLLETHIPSVDMQTAANLYPTLRMALQNRSLKNRIPSRFVIEARRWNTGLRLDLWVANSSGRILDQAFCSLTPIGNPTLSTPVPGETPVELSNLSQQLIDAINQSRKAPFEQRIIKVPEEIGRIVLNPESRDLAELAATDLALAAAKARSVNLVASPTMTHASWCALRTGTVVLTAQRYLRELEEPRLNMKAIVRDGFLVIGAADPYRNRQESAPRRTLGRFFRAVEAKLFPSLDDYTILAPDLHVRLVDSYVAGPLTLLCPQWFRTSPPWEILKLHSALGAQRRQSLMEGEIIKLGLLERLKAQLVNQLVFGNSGDFRLTIPIVAVRSKDEDDSPDRSWDEFLQGIPTELWPQGLPPTLSLSLKRIDAIAITATGVNSLGRTVEMQSDPDGIARWLLAQRTGAPSELSNVQWTSFRSFSKQSYSYKLIHDDEFGYMGMLEDTQELGLPVEQPSLLPTQVWAKVQAALEQLKSSKPPP